MAESTNRIWEKSLEELMVLRHEAIERQNHSTVNLINELLIKREKREEEERKERREIRELEKLTLSRTVATPNFTGAINLFKASLKGGMNNPDKRVLDVLARRFPMQMAVAADDKQNAEDLYREIKSLPATTTALQLQMQSDIYLNGPSSAENVNLLIGSRRDKTPVMVKVLVAASGHPKHSYDTLTKACEEEANICLELNLATTTLPFARCEVFDISSPQKSRKAIVMPTYVRTVADSARLWPASLIDGSKRMIQAIEHMHSHGLVHMDIKGSNILLDQAGEWYLGDFGSTCRIGGSVISTTRSFYPDDLIGKPAMSKYDWLILLVVILIEMLPKKHLWNEELCDDGVNIVVFPKLAISLGKVMSDADTNEELKKLLSEIAIKAELSVC